MSKDEAVRRYDLDREIDGARMAENELGDYVTYEDHVAALSRSEERERVLRDVATAAQKLADAMETCHECKGTVLVDEQPTHCEDCSWDCDTHDGSECATLYGLHLELKRKLSALATPAPEPVKEQQP